MMDGGGAVFLSKIVVLLGMRKVCACWGRSAGVCLDGQ